MSATVGITAAILGGALAQLLMKTGLRAVTLNDLDSIVYSLVTHPLSTLLILTGVVFYGLSMVVWVHTLKKHKLSKAYPILSLGYVVVYLLAAFWPGIQEAYTFQKSLGISLIVFGVWFSQRSTTASAI